jgi:hypothetical protein
MELNVEYAARCTELGNLDLEIEVRQRRRAELLAEMEVLQKLALKITQQQQQRGGPHVAAPVNAAPNRPAAE